MQLLIGRIAPYLLLRLPLVSHLAVRRLHRHKRSFVRDHFDRLPKKRKSRIEKSISFLIVSHFSVTPLPVAEYTCRV